MLRRNFRDVKFLEARFGNHNGFDVKYSVNDSMEEVASRVAAGQALKWNPDETTYTAIRDLTIDPRRRIAFGLLHYGSTDLCDPAFVHTLKHTIRVAGRGDSEVVAFSAHFALSLVESKGRVPGSHLMLLEHVPTIASGTARTILNWVLKESCKVGFDDPATKKRLITWPTILLDGYKSQTLNQALKDGSVAGVEIIYEKPNEVLDERLPIPIAKRTLKLDIGQDGSASKLRKIRDLVSFCKEERCRMFVRFSDGDKNPRKVEMDLEFAFDTLLVKKEEIALESSLPQCVERMSDEMRIAMAKRLIREREVQGDWETAAAAKTAQLPADPRR